MSTYESHTAGIFKVELLEIAATFVPDEEIGSKTERN